MASDLDPTAEQRHRTMNALAALLANAEFLANTFRGSTPDAPLLADASPEARSDALTAVQHIVESAQALTALITK